MKDELVLALTTIEMFRIWDVQDKAAIAMLGGRDEPSQGVLDRVILLLCIHEALKGMFGEPERIRRWLHAQNTLFEGRSPLALIANGDIASLHRLKDYLFAESQGF